MKVRKISTLALLFSGILLLSGLFLSVLSLTAQADELQEPLEENPVSKAPLNPTLDSRMPAVVPGEEVSRSGRKMKVWSSGGSPSERVEAPQAPVANDQWRVNDGQPDDVSVIIDGRGLRHPRNRR